MAPASSTLLSDLVVLFKLRIVFLLLLAAVGGLFLGAHGWPGGGPLALTLVTGGLAAMGSSAWNQYLERESDAQMTRTRRRPLVTGAIARPSWVPYVATAMIALPVLAVLPFNPALAFFLSLGAFIYVVIYTVWLKPRTPLNIVIGGAAGSAAVLAGAAAANAWTDPGVIALAILLFFWTPIHFWALALVYREDYARAKVPMLPVTSAPRDGRGLGLRARCGCGAGRNGHGLPTLPGAGLHRAGGDHYGDPAVSKCGPDRRANQTQGVWGLSHLEPVSLDRLVGRGRRLGDTIPALEGC